MKCLSCKTIFMVSVISIFISILLCGCGGNTVIDKDSDGLSEKTSENKIDVLDENGKIYVSLNDAFLYYDGKCSIHGDEAVASKGEDELVVVAGNPEASLNGDKITMEEKPLLKNGEMYVPVFLLRDSMDARVYYDNVSKKVSINTVMPLKYATTFKVEYLKGGLKKVTDGEGRIIIVVPAGQRVPPEYKDFTLVNTASDNIMLATTVQGCFFRAMNAASAVSCVTTSKELWQIKEFTDAMEKGTIQFVGQLNGLDYEMIAAKKLSISFICPGPFELDPVKEKFDELRIPYAVSTEHLEEDPLGRLEWIKFYAAFLDKEDQAEKYFNSIDEKVSAIKNANKNKEKTKVAWGIVYNGRVYITYPDSYVAKMIDLAGGEYLFNDFKIPASGSITLEEFYAGAVDADVLIYSSICSYAPTLKFVTDQAPVLSNLKSVKNKNVWCFSQDYFQSVDKTDEIISELAVIFHGNENEKKKVRHYIRYDK